jgi:serine beta-lactamase-like protein LACTB, mitochondrial
MALNFPSSNEPRSPGRSLRVRQAFVAAFAVGLFLGGLANCRAAELASEKTNAVDTAINRFMAEKRVPGLSAAIVTEGQLSFERGYGLADVENQVPASPATVYRLASISKMLTAVAAMQLVEHGKLDLAATIQKYVPSFPEKAAPITAELLLKHQSGIRHYKGDEVRSAVFYNRVTDSLPIFQNDPLLFTPGEKFSYTTYGYNLLGAAIEAASGQDYVRYVQEHVCQPSGMTTIRPDNPYQIIPHRAAGYRIKGSPAKGELLNDFMVDVSNKIPGGGWCSTAGDLGRFAIALADGKLVSRETLERMWTPQVAADGKASGYGYGCNISVVNGQRLIAHSGGQPKVSTYLVISPERRAAVALMCNLQNTPVQALAGEIIEIIAKSDP